MAASLGSIGGSSRLKVTCSSEEMNLAAVPLRCGGTVSSSGGSNKVAVPSIPGEEFPQVTETDLEFQTKNLLFVRGTCLQKFTSRPSLADTGG